jgi:hypothetical protein
VHREARPAHRPERGDRHQGGEREHSGDDRAGHRASTVAGDEPSAPAGEGDKEAIAVPSAGGVRRLRRDVSEIGDYGPRNDRIRTEGTRNLIAAAQKAATGERFIAQSIAWRPPGRGAGVDEHERLGLGQNGRVLRYGQLYGPGTYYEDRKPDHPRVHVTVAAEITAALLDAPPGVLAIAEDERGQVAARPDQPPT